MGVLAFAEDQPVGWLACGPRSRYRTSPAGRQLLAERPDAEDSPGTEDSRGTEVPGRVIMRRDLTLTEADQPS